MRGWGLVVLGAALAGCIDTVPADDSAECAADVPTVTWATFGEGFVATHCQGCHASNAADRQGAPPELIFDTRDDASELGPWILDAVTSDPPRMPPAGGPTDDERERLRVWLTCFAGG